MLKSMGTKLLRETSDLLPQGVSSDCGATGRKASSDAKREEGNVREASNVAGGGAAGEDLDSGAALTGISVSTKKGREKDCTRKNIGGFSGTPTWCFSFMKREGVSMRMRTKLAPKLPAANENQALEFHSYVISLQKIYNFELSQIANMDEATLTFDVPSNKTVDVQGAKTMDVKTSGHEKTYFTVVLACCADGTKLPPMIIFKRKTFPKEKIPTGVIVHMHEEGWMNEGGMKICLNRVWSQRPGGLLKKPSLLVFDHFKAHVTQSAKAISADLKTQLSVMPGGLTSELQPLDAL